MEEQQRIVELFRSLDDVHECLLTASDASLTLKSSLTENAFPVSEVKSYLNDPESYQGRFLVKLGDLVTLQVGFPFKSAEYSKSGDRLLRGSNVGMNRLLWGNDITCYWPTERRNEVRDYVLNVGDLVIAMDRPFISEGFKIAKVSELDLPALLLQRVGRFRLSNKITADYLWSFLHAESLKWQLQRMQKGTDLPHISRFDIEGTLIPIQSIEEQTEVADLFSSTANAGSSLLVRADANRKQRTAALLSQIVSETPNV
jgi:type I restriction enzyme S subunit